MNTLQIKQAALDLGMRAEAMDLWLQAHPDISEMKKKNIKENIRVMFNGEKAIHELQQRIDFLSAYIWQRKTEVETTRHLIDSIIQHER